MATGLGEAKARQVYLVLRDRILTGVFASGARLPNEHDLAQAHGVSRVTLRRALAEGFERVVGSRDVPGHRCFAQRARRLISRRRGSNQTFRTIAPGARDRHPHIHGEGSREAT